MKFHQQTSSFDQTWSDLKKFDKIFPWFHRMHLMNFDQIWSIPFFLCISKKNLLLLLLLDTRYQIILYSIHQQGNLPNHKSLISTGQNLLQRISSSNLTIKISFAKVDMEELIWVRGRVVVKIWKTE